MSPQADKMLQEMSHNVGAVPDWRLERRPFDSLYLIELRNVSQGSWQPVFATDV